MIIICIENNVIMSIKQKMIRSIKRNIYTIEQNKKGLSALDDKWYLIEG